MSDEDVPKLPRGRGIRLSRPQLIRVLGLALLLVFLVVMQRPCADSVSKFVTGFGDQGSASPTLPRPGSVDVPAGSATTAGSATGSNELDGYERLRPGMTDEEVKAVIDRARARATGTP